MLEMQEEYSQSHRFIFDGGEKCLGSTIYILQTGLHLFFFIPQKFLVFSLQKYPL